MGEPKTTKEMTRDELLEVIGHLENDCEYLRLKERAWLELKARGMDAAKTGEPQNVPK